MQTKSASVAFKSATLSANGAFEGHGSVFGNVDLGGDVVMPGAFRESLDTHQAEGTAPAMLWSHDPNEPIGKWLSMREDQVGLRVEGKLTLDVPRAKAAYALMRDDALALSIGYQAKVFNYDERGIRLLHQVELFEVSPVAIPMNPKARINGVKSIPDKRTLETKLRDELGFSAREARRAAGPCWNALIKSPHDDSAELEEISRELRELTSSFGEV